MKYFLSSVIPPIISIIDTAVFNRDDIRGFLKEEWQELIVLFLFYY